MEQNSSHLQARTGAEVTFDDGFRGPQKGEGKTRCGLQTVLKYTRGPACDPLTGLAANLTPVSGRDACKIGPGGMGK